MKKFLLSLLLVNSALAQPIGWQPIITPLPGAVVIPDGSVTTNKVDATFATWIGSGGGGGGDISADSSNNIVNRMVSFTITTNLASTNVLFVENAGAGSGTYTNRGGWWARIGPVWWVTNKAGMWTVENATADDYTNGALTGLYTLGTGTSPAPGVYFPSNITTYTTNWFVAAQSYALPEQIVNLRDFGGHGDAKKSYGVFVTSGQAYCTTGSWTADDVGKYISIYTTLTNSDYVLTRVTAFNNSTNITLGTNYTQALACEAWTFRDETVAWSNAIRSATGSFTLVVPDGVHCFASMSPTANSGHYAAINLTLDNDSNTTTNRARMIKIVGETPAMIYPQFINGGGATTLGSPNSGSILMNFARPIGGYTNAFIVHDGTGIGFSGFARENYTFENITIRQPSRPLMHALWFAKGGTLALNEVTIDVDMSRNWLDETTGKPPFYMMNSHDAPTQSATNFTAGLWGPDPYNYAGMSLRNVTIGYHGVGLRWGEHTHGLGNVSMVACGLGGIADGAVGGLGTWDGAYFASFFTYLCPRQILIATNSTNEEPISFGRLAFETADSDVGSHILDPFNRGVIFAGTVGGTEQTVTIDSTNAIWFNAKDRVWHTPAFVAEARKLAATNIITGTLNVTGQATNGTLVTTGTINAGGTITRGSSSVATTLITSGGAVAVGGGGGFITTIPGNIRGIAIQNNSTTDIGYLSTNQTVFGQLTVSNMLTSSYNISGTNFIGGSTFMATNIAPGFVIMNNWTLGTLYTNSTASSLQARRARVGASWTCTAGAAGIANVIMFVISSTQSATNSASIRVSGANDVNEGHLILDVNPNDTFIFNDADSGTGSSAIVLGTGSWVGQ